MSTPPHSDMWKNYNQTPIMQATLIKTERGFTVIETMKYRKKEFFVDAVQVTAANMIDVAQWCGGEVRGTDSPEVDAQAPYIKVKVLNPLNDRQTQAFVGCWILLSKGTFKVYTNKAFRNNFDQESTETTLHGLSGDVIHPAADDIPEELEVVVPIVETAAEPSAPVFSDEELAQADAAKITKSPKPGPPATPVSTPIAQ